MSHARESEVCLARLSRPMGYFSLRTGRPVSAIAPWTFTVVVLIIRFGVADSAVPLFGRCYDADKSL